MQLEARTTQLVPRDDDVTIRDFENRHGSITDHADPASSIAFCSNTVQKRACNG